MKNFYSNYFGANSASDSNLDAQWANYRAHEQSLWHRHKGKISIGSTLMVGVFFCMLAIILSSLNVYLLVDAGPVVQAILGFLVGIIPTGTTLGLAYTYSSCKSEPVIYFDSTSDYHHSSDSEEGTSRNSSEQHEDLYLLDSGFGSGPIPSLREVLLRGKSSGFRGSVTGQNYDAHRQLEDNAKLTI